jgi:aspartate racemase
MKFKTIGILGGMGPGASSTLYSKMISYTQQQYNAVQDEHYPPIIIYSLPLKGFNETGITEPECVKKQLIDGVKKLEDAGCELIIIACNTVHVFYNEMQEAVKVPIFNIVQETLKQVQKSGYKKVGIFASECTIKTNLYTQQFAKNDIHIIEPNGTQQKQLNNVIEHVMGGNQKVQDVIALKEIAREYTKQGAEAIVMGCTEIPLAINQTHTDIKLFNTIEIIVQTAVDFSLN